MNIRGINNIYIYGFCVVLTILFYTFTLSNIPVFAQTAETATTPTQIDSEVLDNNMFSQDMIHLTGDYYVHTGWTQKDENGTAGTFIPARHLIRLLTIVDGEITQIGGAHSAYLYTNSLSFYVETSAPQIETSIEKLDDDTVVVSGYRLGSGGARGYNVITFDVDTSDGTFTEVDSVQFQSATSTSRVNEPQLALVGDDKLFVAYAYGNAPYPGWVKTIGIDSDGDIGSVLSEFRFNTKQGRSSSLVKWDDDTLILSYRGNGADGHIRSFDVAEDGSITAGDDQKFTPAEDRIAYTSLVKIDDDTLAVAYSEILSGHEDGRVELIDVSPSGVFTVQDLEIYFGDAVTINQEERIHLNSIALLDSDTLAVAYRGEGTHGFIRLYNFDATSLTPLGEPFEHDTSYGAWNSLHRLDSTTLALLYSGDIPGSAILTTNEVPSTIKTISYAEAPTVTPTVSIDVVSDGFVNDSEDGGAITIEGESTDIAENEEITITFSDSNITEKLATVDDSGDWSTTIPTDEISAAAEGEITVTATYSEVTATQTFVHDSTAPTLQVANEIGDQTATAGEAFRLDFPTGTYFEDNDSITYSRVGEGNGISYDENENAWIGSAPTEGDITIIVTATDVAGNTATDVFTITISAATETADPAISINKISEDGYVNASEDDADVTISGTSTDIAENEEITITFSDSAITEKTATVGADGTWSAIIPTEQISVATEGTVRVRAEYSSATAAQTFTYDRTAPAVVEIDDQTTTIGANFLFQIPTGTFTDANTLTYSSEGQEKGITFSTDTWNGPTTETGVVTITVTATDAAGNTATDVFTITISPVVPINRAPTNITLTLTNAIVYENQTVVGTLSTEDDSGGTYIYSLEDGTGDEDNSKFSISENTLSFSTELDHENPTDLGDNVGDNTYSIRVRTTDQGGEIYEKKFIITVADVAENNANLTDLEVAGATIGAFAEGTTEYSATVANSVTSVTVTPTVSHPEAVVTVAGTTVVSGETSGAITLVDGENTINVVVTAEDGSTKTYTITITRTAAPTISITTPISTDGYVNNTDDNSDITIEGTSANIDDDGIISFSISDTDSTTADITTTAIVTSNNWVATIDSTDIQGLVEGEITVTATYSSATATQPFTYDRTAPSEPTLSITDTGSDTSDNITNNPTVTVTGIETGSSWEYRESGGSWVDGVGSTFTLTEGRVNYQARQTDLAGNVSADSATLSATYDSIAPTSSGITNQTATIGTDFSFTIPSGTFTDANTLTYTSSGEDNGISFLIKIWSGVGTGLTEGILTITVTAEDAAGNTTEDVFTITISPAPNNPPTNITLALTNDPVNENQTVVGTFSTEDDDDEDTHRYFLVAGTGGEDNGKFILDSDSGVIAFSAAPDHELPSDNDSNNTYSIRVQTNDGTVTYEKKFIITVADVAENNANLTDLEVAGATIGAFAEGTTEYSATVANSVTSVTVTPTVFHIDATAVVTVGGIEETGAITLVDGENTITIVVTAEDGSTTKTYTITITRTAAPTISITTPISTDGYVNDEEDNDPVTISGTSTNIGDADTITLTIVDSDTTDGTDLTKTPAVASDGTWAQELTSTEVKGLAEGEVTVTATYSSATGTQTFTYDRTAPTLLLANEIQDTTAQVENSFTLSIPSTYFTDQNTITYTSTGANNGISFDSGTWSGTPTQAGQLTITVTATDAAGNSATDEFNIDIADANASPTISFAPSSSNTTPTQSFGLTINVADGDTSDEVSAEYIQIASGATCDSGATASGTTTIAGTGNTLSTSLSFTAESDNDTKICVVANDNGSPVRTIYATSPTIAEIDTTAPTLLLANEIQDTTAQVENSFTLSIPSTYFTDQNTITYTSTGANNGISFDSGTWSGTPTQAGQLTITVTATDAAGNSATDEFNIDIADANASPTISFAPSSSNTTPTQSFGLTINVADGDSSDEVSAEYIQIASSATCDSGATASGTTVITGTGNSLSTSLSFTAESDNDTKICVVANDNGSPVREVYLSSPTIAEIDTTAPTLLPANEIQDTTAQVENFFTYSIPSTYFTDQNTISYSSTGANNGISFDSGTWSGTPTQAGQLTITVTATDAAGNSATDEFNIDIADANASPTISFAPSSSNTTPTQSFGLTINVADGDSSDEVSAEYIQIASGATCDSGATASGTTTIAGTGNTLSTSLSFTAESDNDTKICVVANDNGSPVRTIYATSPTIAEIDTTAPTLLLANEIQDTTAQVENSFTLSIPSTYFTDQNTITYTSTGANNGISFDSGTWSGTPTQAGQLTITVTATDAAGNSATDEFNIDIADANASPTISFSPSSSNTTPTQSFGLTINVADGDVSDEVSAEYIQIASSATCDSGATASGTTVITGTGNTLSTSLSFTAESDNDTKICVVANDNGSPVRTIYATSPTIAEIDTTAPTLLLANEIQDTTAQVENSFTLSIPSTYFTDQNTITYTSTGANNGISFDSGTWSGTPTQAGQLTITVTATDAAGNSATDEFNIDIADANASPTISFAPSSSNTTPTQSFGLTINVADGDTSDEVSAEYIQIASGATCDSGATASGTTTIAGTGNTLSTSLSFTAESDNDTKICVVANDNGSPVRTIYATSPTIAEIDTTAPTLLLANEIQDTTAQVENSFTLSIPSTYFTDQNTITYTSTGANNGISFDSGTWSGTPTQAGQLTITVTATDAAGNSATDEFNIDIADANASPTISFAPSSSNTTPTQSFGLTINVADGDSSDEVSAEYIQIASSATCDSGATASGTTTIAGTGNTLSTSLSFTAESDNDTKICVVANDNGSPVREVYLSSPTIEEIDTTAPSSPTLSITDTGSNTSDNITNNPTVTVTGLEANATWEYREGTGNWTAGTGSTFTLTTQGEADYQARQTDVAGNGSTVSAAQTFTYDSTAPATPSLSITDTGSNTSDSITNNPTVTVTGLETDATWEYKEGAGNWTAGTGTTFTLSEVEADYQVRQTDVAGNLSGESSASSFTLDQTNPSAPTLSITDTGSDNSDGITNNSTVTVTGLETDATWEYKEGAGNWTAGTGTTFTLSEVEADYQVRQTDVAGNVSAASIAISITYDTTSPSTPSLSITDTGSNTSDNITNNPTVTVTGLEANATWEYREGAGNWTAGTGTTFTLTTQAEADYQVRQTDVAGNISSASIAISITYDATTLSAPTLSITDTGSDNSDGITNNPTVTVEGLETDATWEYQVGTEAWTAGTGTNFSLTDGVFNYKVRQTDLAGNLSAESSAYSFTLDQTNPSASTLSITDTGSNTSDSITNNPTVTVTGLETDATWEYREGTGNWTAGTGSTFTLTTQAEADYQARQTDVAGNQSAESTALSITYDTTSPSAPTLSITDTGSNTSDNITNNPTVTVTGLETDATWEYKEGTGNWTTGTGSTFTLTTQGEADYQVRQTDVAGNQSAESSAYSFTLDQTNPSAPTLSITDTGSNTSDNITNNPTVTVTGLETDATWEYKEGTGNWTTGTGTTFTLTTQGEADYQARQTDVAGNLSAASTALSITYDSTAPSAPTLSITDTGSDNSDGITNNSTVTVEGLEANATWEYREGAGNWTAGTGSTFTLTEVTVNYQARQTDVAGNQSAESTALSITYDTTSPSAPTLSITDTGSNTSDNITNNSTVTVTGLEANATWEYREGTGNWTTGTGTTFTLTTQAEADYQARQTDVAGNVSVESTAVSITYDSTAPSAPTLSITDTGSNTSDSITNNPTVTVTGLDANATWEYKEGTGNWTTGTGTIFTLTEGTVNYQARQTDAAGNLSAVSAAQTFTYDSTAPATPSLSITDTGSNTSDSITNNPTVTVTGLDANATWEYREGTGNWTAGTGSTFTLTEGTANYQARQTDVAGNVSSASIALSITYDSTAPTFSVARTGTERGETNNIAIEINENLSGTATATDFTLSYEGVTDANPTSASVESRNINIIVSSGIQVGDNSITVSYSGTAITDIAGNALPPFANQTVENRVVISAGGGGGSIIFSGRSASAVNIAPTIPNQYSATEPVERTVVPLRTTSPSAQRQVIQTGVSLQFNRDLSIGLEGEDVKELQIFLNNSGFPVSDSGAGSKGQETRYFGPATQRALAEYQRINDIPATGYFGSLTRGSIDLTPTTESKEVLISIILEKISQIEIAIKRLKEKKEAGEDDVDLD